MYQFDERHIIDAINEANGSSLAHSDFLEARNVRVNDGSDPKYTHNTLLDIRLKGLIPDVWQTVSYDRLDIAVYFNMLGGLVEYEGLFDGYDIHVSNIMGKLRTRYGIYTQGIMNGVTADGDYVFKPDTTKDNIIHVTAVETDKFHFGSATFKVVPTWEDMEKAALETFNLDTMVTNQNGNVKPSQSLLNREVAYNKDRVTPDYEHLIAHLDMTALLGYEEGRTVSDIVYGSTDKDGNPCLKFTPETLEKVNSKLNHAGCPSLPSAVVWVGTDQVSDVVRDNVIYFRSGYSPDGWKGAAFTIADDLKNINYQFVIKSDIDYYEAIGDVIPPYKLSFRIKSSLV